MSPLNQIGAYATILTTTLPLLMIAGFFIVLARNILSKQKAARGWPVAQGRVLVSDIQARTHTVGNTGGRATSYYAHVVYEYRVGGADYRSSRISPGDEIGYGNSRRATARAGRYPPGAQVSVIYNPEDPNEAMLELGSPRMKILFWIGGVMVLFLLLSSGLSWGVVRFTQWVIGTVPH